LFSWGKVWCELAIQESVQAEERILNGTCGPSPLTTVRHAKPRIDTWQVEDPRKGWDNMVNDWEAAGKKGGEEKGSITRAYSFQTRMEQAPNPNSRVTLAKEKDEFGIPLANLHWQLTDLDKRSLRRINQIIGQQAGAAGFARLKLIESLRDDNDSSWPEGTSAGWHHMGTTRMSDDPKKGVVDKNCQVHGITNLFVAGSGCYTTSAAPNPTLTLVALSLRLSDFLRSSLDQKK
jgi:choline dehydrogenase-like flavoprotein